MDSPHPGNPSLRQFCKILSITLVILVPVTTNDSFDSLIVNIKSNTVMAKAAFNTKKRLFTSKLHLNFRKKVVSVVSLAQHCMVLKI